MLKESNNADQKLIVGSLEVLTDIKNHGLNIIKSTVNELQNEQKTEKQKTADFYAAMAEDGIITPIEKKTLKSELNTIERTHAAILSDAEKNKCKNIEEIKNYENLFGYLIVYLYSNLKVFDNPSENTQIDKNEFNRVFSDYYTAEKAAISSIDRKESHDYATQEDIKHHTATYLGSISKLPETLHSDYGIGDWFTWSGATEDCEIASNGKLIKGHIYKQTFIDDATHWQEVNPAEKDAQGFNVHSQEIMTALNDILSLNDAKDGYFQNVFASSFFAASAVIESLKVHFLRVANDGALQTDNYEPSKQGWIITDEQGAKSQNLKYPVEFMSDVHTGGDFVATGKTSIDGDLNIGKKLNIGNEIVIEKQKLIGSTRVFKNALQMFTSYIKKGNFDRNGTYFEELKSRRNIYFDTLEWTYGTDTHTYREHDPDGGGEESEDYNFVILKLWNNGALVYVKEYTTLNYWGDKKEPGWYELLCSRIVVKEKDSNSFNIKMTNLRKGKPAAANYIYQEDGYLKIS